MSALLTSGDKKTPFKEFLKGVEAIDNTYTKHYLQAEYNHALSSSQMMSKWQQIEDEAEVFPFLQFDAVNDDRTRKSHAALDGVVRPIKDDFWKTHYPPLDWNCRCTVRQLDEDDADGRQDKPLPEDMPKVPALFKQNVGATGIVYSAKHPYFTSIPSDKLKQVIDESGELIIGKIKPERWKVLTMNRAAQFENVSGVFVHKLIDRNRKSYFNEFSEALENVKKGIEVEMLPELHEQEKAFRSKVFPTFNKPDIHPDYRFNKTKYVELENATGNSRNNIKHAIQVGAKQADYVIVKSAGSITLQDIHRAAGSAFKDYQNLQEIEIVQGGERIVIKRKKPNQK